MVSLMSVVGPSGGVSLSLSRIAIGHISNSAAVVMAGVDGGDDDDGDDVKLQLDGDGVDFPLRNFPGGISACRRTLFSLVQQDPAAPWGGEVQRRGRRSGYGRRRALAEEKRWPRSATGGLRAMTEEQLGVRARGHGCAAPKLASPLPLWEGAVGATARSPVHFPACRRN
ncbi:hypothetical protein QYE76_057477 [Lolium multiflorum]|uniref:Uncharacterized protein n=1 Tax=Lolium multiflorum TaxID=4521 RepID=A0AAD8T599_LOLMU|nr:hypothetical protein QYE76_057477 [Lolium multiflorum]